MRQFEKRCWKVGIAGAWIAAAALCAVSSTRAATPYEAQLSGRVYAVLTTLIIGEFGGKTRASTDSTVNKRLCEPADYEILKEAAQDNVTMIAFHRRCALVATKVDDTHVHSIAHPPTGYCEIFKRAFEMVLADKVYSVPNASRDWMIVEHKALRLHVGVADREMLRRAQLRAACQDDGVLLVSAPRKPRST